MLAKLQSYFKSREIHADLDEEDQYLHIHNGMCIVYIENNSINVTFEVNMDPTSSAIVSGELYKFSMDNKLQFFVHEPFAHVVDEQNNIIEVLFGDEAIHYHETGEVRVVLEKKKEEEDEDQKRLDSILDQISKKGMKSLNKSDKRFLIKFSKKCD